MSKKEILTKKDLYESNIDSSALGFMIYSCIITSIALVLGRLRLWLPLSILFFGYIMGLFSGFDWSSYSYNKKKFEEELKQ